MALDATVRIGTTPEHECDNVRWEWPRTKWVGNEFRAVWTCQCGYMFRRVRLPRA